MPSATMLKSSDTSHRSHVPCLTFVLVCPRCGEARPWRHHAELAEGLVEAAPVKVTQRSLRIVETEDTQIGLLQEQVVGTGSAPVRTATRRSISDEVSIAPSDSISCVHAECIQCVPLPLT